MMKVGALTILLVASFSYFVKIANGLACNTPVALGMESGTIVNSQITASSFYTGQGELRGYKGRLNGASYWATASANPAEKWIQVDLLTTNCYIVSGIKTQGSSMTYQEWVTNLKVRYGQLSGTESYIMDGGSAKTFAANVDKTTVKEITFPDAVKTRFIRVVPTTCNDWCSLRLEIMGCSIGCSTPSPPLCISNRAEQYRVVNEFKDSWANARQYCQSLGRADLAVIENGDELAYVRGLLSGSTTLGHWLGMTDTTQEGTWKWLDGSIKDGTSNWHSTEPNGNTNENCGILMKTSDPERGYADAQCDMNFNFICEFYKCHEEELKKEDGHKLQNHLLYRVKVNRLNKCTKTCIEDRTCRSVNLIPVADEANTFWCELNDSTKELSASDYVTLEGGTYAGII